MRLAAVASLCAGLDEEVAGAAVSGREESTRVRQPVLNGKPAVIGIGVIAADEFQVVRVPTFFPIQLFDQRFLCRDQSGPSRERSHEFGLLRPRKLCQRFGCQHQAAAVLQREVRQQNRQGPVAQVGELASGEWGHRPVRNRRCRLQVQWRRSRLCPCGWRGVRLGVLLRLDRVRVQSSGLHALAPVAGCGSAPRLLQWVTRVSCWFPVPIADVSAEAGRHWSWANCVPAPAE